MTSKLFWKYESPTFIENILIPLLKLASTWTEAKYFVQRSAAENLEYDNLHWGNPEGENLYINLKSGNLDK